MDCQGNMILCGLPIDIQVMPQSLSKVTRGCVHSCTVQRRKTIAHTSGAAQWTLGSRCDKNKDCRHLRVSCAHTKPRSSLSAQMCHSGGLTARRVPLHAWVLCTYWKSIAIFQWQLQYLDNSLYSIEFGKICMQVFHGWKVKGGQTVTWFIFYWTH